MNCCECEQLFDAYLDGHLAGSLRLEFDAHRLRCRRCQQTLAMLETIGHVIASDPHVPELPASFTDRVLRDIARPRGGVLRFPRTRVAVVTAALAQAAAVLAIAVLWNTRPAASAPSAAAPALASVTDDAEVRDPAYNAVLGVIVEGVEDRLWAMHAAGSKLTSEVKNLARYLDISLPEDVARESSKIAGVNPWQAFWGTLGPNEEEPEPTPSADDVHSI
jgi:hypothetical protein